MTPEPFAILLAVVAIVLTWHTVRDVWRSR